MHLLIIGGTVFLGRHLVQAARERGHTVTLFNRGQHNPELFPDVEKLRGDRKVEADLHAALQGRRFDAVIDTCGYVPRVVRLSAERLTDKADRYCFISSVSAYSDMTTNGLDENGPTGTLEDPMVEEVTGATYGPLKALCEQAAEAAFPGRALNIRPGLIVGPDDPTDRFTYWPHRVAQGGEVLAPGDGTQPVQIIDVRDLAEWTIRLLEDGKSGIYNAVGPETPLTLGEVLETCRTVSGSDARFTWVPEPFLEEREVRQWIELPLWVSASGESGGLNTVSNAKGVADGLTFRQLADTVRDTLSWDAARPQESAWKATLKPDKERAVLEAWTAKGGAAPV
jgi:2'-hydroxyisoflavone reductase